MPRVAKTPVAMTSTPEEDAFFAKDRASSRQIEESQDEAEEVQGAAEGSESAPSEAEVEAEPGTAPEPSDGGEEAKQEDASTEEATGRTVPIGELYAERERRKVAETLQQQQASRIQQLEDTFKKVVDRIGGLQQAPAQPEQNVPAYEADPLAHLKATQDQIVRHMVGTNQWTQIQEAEKQLQAYIFSAENQFRSVRPDYDAAAAYARDLRMKELELVSTNPTSIADALKQDIISIANKAYTTGRNPAEIYYEYAQLRGYKPQSQAQPQTQPQASRQGNGAQKLQQIAKAQAATKSPKGGAAPVQDTTLSDLANMSDSEFDANFEKFWRQT